MTDQSISINWLNNCVVNQTNSLHIQRSSNLGFFHPKANITKIQNEHTNQIDLAAPTCTYHDNDLTGGSYYSYRVVVDTPNGRAQSTPTSPVYVPDLQTDLGYVSGNPTSTFNFNIASEPIVHIDSDRLYNTCGDSNEIIKNPRTMLRHKCDKIHNIHVTGDPIYDSRDAGQHTRFICARTNISYNQSHQTENMSSTDMTVDLSDDIICESGATMYVSLYTEYTSPDKNMVFKPTSDVSIIWSHDTVMLKTPAGRRSFRRTYKSPWVVYTIKYTTNNIKLWENGVYVGTVHTDNKTSFVWSKQSPIALLGTGKDNYGFSELILFDESHHASTVDIITRYMCTKYAVDHTPVIPSDL